MVLRSGVRSSFRRNGRYFEKNGQVPNLRSMRLTLSGTRGTCEYEREILPGQRERSDTSSAAPCSVWCRQSSGSTRSLAERLSASLSLCSASTRRSPVASNLREVMGLQTVGNGGRQGRQMAGNWLRLHSVVRSAPAQTCARSGRGQHLGHAKCEVFFVTKKRPKYKYANG